MKLLKFFGKRRARKGFTLIELIVVVAIIAVLMACVVAFAQPIRSMMSNTNARSDAITINNCLGNYIERRLAYANDIKVLIGFNYGTDTIDSTTTPPLTQSKLYEDMYNNHSQNADHPGMMIFHLDNTNGTFKAYDIDMKKTGTGSAMPAAPSILLDGNLIYTDDFFGRYSYFITCDTRGDAKNRPQINAAKKAAFLDFRIDSYDFGDEASKIDATVVKGYYDYINGKTGATDTFEDISIYRSGRENISFALENIEVKVDYASDGSGEFDPNIRDTPKAKVYRSGAGGTTSAASTDIVILYNVRKYSEDDI